MKKNQKRSYSNKLAYIVIFIDIYEDATLAALNFPTLSTFSPRSLKFC